MKLCAILVVILGTSANVYGLICFSCSADSFNGEIDRTGVCFSTSTETPATTTVSCPSNFESTVYYCQTEFGVRDGVVTEVYRSCASSATDEDIFTDDFPTNDKCVTQLDENRNPTAKTNCYYHCNEDRCNTETSDMLKTCGSNCSYPDGNCNYITGNCVCNSGYSGDSCLTRDSPTPLRKCIQCNTATDGSCTSSSTSYDCPSTQAYCSTTTTNIYDKSGNAVNKLTTRGCTSSFRAVDECKFTDIYDDAGIRSVGYNELTCYSTCNSDGCNNNNANGVVDGDEKILMECVQCDSTSGNCQSPRKVCPSGTTHCKSTVVYLISDRVDSRYKEEPDYRLLSVVHECATASVIKECTETTVDDLNMKKVTCTETCQEDGCNTGWPARPKCIICTSSFTRPADGYDICLENPSIPGDCSAPYEEYCVIQETGITKGSRQSVQGYPHTIRRGCSYHDIGTGCSTEKPRETEIQTCNRTCTTDGCNVGSGSPMLFQTFTAVLISTMLGWMTQTHF